jgi:hypothetical protein
MLKIIHYIPTKQQYQILTLVKIIFSNKDSVNFRENRIKNNTDKNSKTIA